MSVQWVLLPVFVLVGLTFALLIGMVAARRSALKGAQTRSQGYRAGQAELAGAPPRYGNCFRNQFEVPVLFYVLIALALPLRHADLVIVLLSWVFVVTPLRPCRHFRHVPTTCAALAWRGSPACWCCSRCGSISR